MVNILLSWYNFADGYLKDELLKICKPSDKVAIVSFAHRDDADEAAYDLRYGKNGKHFVCPANEFIKLGIPGGNICLVHYFEDSADEIRPKMEQADIWMLTGGMPDRAVARIHERGLTEAFAASGKVVMGVSAGALMQLGEYFLTPDEDYPQLVFEKGLGLIQNDFYIEVHYDRDNADSTALLNDIRRSTGKPIYAIGACGAVVADDSGAIKLFGDVTLF